MHGPRLAAAVALLTTVAPAQQAVDFGAEVLPILEDACFRCHRGAYVDERGRTRKPKGGLRLDGVGWMHQGGDEGAVLVAGEPEESSLYTRVMLPEDDDDRMPQKGERLTDAQTEVLRAWIAGGAGFGGWLGEPGGSELEVVPPAVVPPYVQLITKLGQGVSAAPAAALAKARGGVAQITIAQPGSPLLRVEFLSREAEVTDREVRALGPLSSWITQLNLGRTAITDRALETVGGMKRLTRLNLHGTAVTDRGLARLERLSELRSLNLYGTAVSDRGLAVIGELSALEAVFLWGTRVTENGVGELRQRLPKARVHHVLVLPEVPVAPPREQPGRRRRK